MKTQELIHLTEKTALSMTEAGRIAGCGRTSIYRSIKTGDLVARKIGARTIILRAELDRWLAALPARRVGKKVEAACPVQTGAINSR